MFAFWPTRNAEDPDLRASEQAKIDCGIEHFKALSQDKGGKALDNPAKFVKADNYNTFATYLQEDF